MTHITSYDAATGGNVVNEVKNTYADGGANGGTWGRLTMSEQAHTGAVGGGTPAVEYAFADGASGSDARFVRLASVTYPGGSTRRVVYFNYPASGVGAMLSRLDNIAADANGNTQYGQYTYLGAGTIVRIEHPAVTGGLVLTYGTGGTYGGFDRFGRVIDQKWTNTAGTIKDRFQYGYDRAGNRLYKDMPTDVYANNDQDEEYEYDNLHRLAKAERGTLSGTPLTMSIPDTYEHWPEMETLGNWRYYIRDGSFGQVRWHNKANEIDTDDDHSNGPGNSIDNIEPFPGDWIDPKYDAAGNMTQMPRTGNEATTRIHLVYDGWNRLAEAKNDDEGSPGTTIATYRYDGLGRRIRKLINGGDTFDYYYNEGYQLLETRKDADGDPFEQYAWDISYIDAPLVRWHDGDTDGTVDDTLWPTRDANFNVTGLFDSGGTLTTRYTYNPYGRRIKTYDDENEYEWTLGHQGLMHDEETGLVYNRRRMLHVTLGRFLQRDPIGYVDGLSCYEYVMGHPLQEQDPGGTESWNESHRKMQNCVNDCIEANGGLTENQCFDRCENGYYGSRPGRAPALIAWLRSTVPAAPSFEGLSAEFTPIERKLLEVWTPYGPIKVTAKVGVKFQRCCCDNDGRPRMQGEVKVEAGAKFCLGYGGSLPFDEKWGKPTIILGAYPSCKKEGFTVGGSFGVEGRAGAIVSLAVKGEVVLKPREPTDFKITAEVKVAAWAGAEVCAFGKVSGTGVWDIK